MPLVWVDCIHWKDTKKLLNKIVYDSVVTVMWIKTEAERGCAKSTPSTNGIVSDEQDIL